MTGSFVRRGGELALLTGLVTAVSAGVGGVVLVEGEQGIGKSTLLRAGLEGAAAGCRVLWGAADELGQQFPLRLMAECLGAGAPGMENRSLGKAAGVFAGDPVLAGVERLLAEIDRLCAVSPVILVAEDLQWADEASVLVWSRLCRAVGQLPLLLAGSCRSGTRREDLGRLRRGVLARGGSVVELGPLPEADVADLVSGLVGGRPGRRLAELMGRAGGNPLYAQELADGLVREGGVTVAEGVAELAGESALMRVPASLAAAIGERLAGLAPDVVEALRWAAVLGAEFSVTDLEVVSGRSAGELIGVIDAAVGAGVVADAGPRLRFRHGLIRQVLYEGLPVALRAALHVQAARALAAADAAPERVAAQLAAGRMAEHPDSEPAPAWVVQWLDATAPVLTYRAPQVAAELLRDVLAQLADTDDRREALEASLVTVAFLLLRHDEVERAGGRLLARARDPDRAAEMAWLVGYTLMRTGRAAEADVAVRAALARPGVSQAWAARLAALHAIVLHVSGQVDEGATTARDALAAAERSGDRLAIGYALHARSTIGFVQRDHMALLADAHQALAVLGEDAQATDLRVMLLANMTSALGDLDRRPEAVAAARQALVLAEQAGTPRLGTARFSLADQYFFSGQWDDALAEVESAVGMPGPNYLPLLVRGLIALISAHRDDWPTTAEHLRELPDQPTLDPGGAANAYYLLLAQALTAERDGRPSDAAAILAITLEPGIAEEMPSRFVLLPALVRHAQAAGNLALAAQAAAAAQDEAERAPLLLKVAMADQCRGMLAGDQGPVLAAAGYFEASGRILDQAAALEDAAVISGRRGELTAARQELAGAIRLHELLGAAWDIRRASARLRPYGVRRARPGYQARPMTGWAALTPTEAKVAYLVTGGRSNPDVAAELFLSRNTVQTHVSHILAKLGARSRAEIIREGLKHPPASRAASA